LKGIVLAGGEGKRLRPLTAVTNKHLLPVFDRPMILHPIEALKSLGINKICLVTGGESIGDFMKFLGSGASFDVKLTYKIQDGSLGIAHALLQAEDFFDKDEKVVVILGDNIFEKVDVPQEAMRDDNAYIFIKEIKNPQRFGVPVFGDGNTVTGIEEKPTSPKSNYAVVGLYIYPSNVFEFIKTLEPSGRGELEITDVNNWYIQQKKMKAIKLDGFWSDAGTFESLFRANMLRAKQTGIEMD
jgi:glucose-1-phosphate thymidylyltransferase